MRKNFNNWPTLPSHSDATLKNKKKESSDSTCKTSQSSPVMFDSQRGSWSANMVGVELNLTPALPTLVHSYFCTRNLFSKKINSTQIAKGEAQIQVYWLLEMKGTVPGPKTIGLAIKKPAAGASIPPMTNIQPTCLSVLLSVCSLGWLHVDWFLPRSFLYASSSQICF